MTMTVGVTRLGYFMLGIEVSRGWSIYAIETPCYPTSMVFVNFLNTPFYQSVYTLCISLSCTTLQLIHQ